MSSDVKIFVLTILYELRFHRIKLNSHLHKYFIYILQEKSNLLTHLEKHIFSTDKNSVGTFFALVGNVISNKISDEKG